jgi:hypothetical protein
VGAAYRPATDPKALSAAFVLVFCDRREHDKDPEDSSLQQGRSPPACPVPGDTDLLNRIRDAVPSASPAVCREALVRVQRLSFDVTAICTAFREGQFGSGDGARAAALHELREHNPGFSDAEYRTAFNLGQLWSGE